MAEKWGDNKSYLSLGRRSTDQSSGTNLVIRSISPTSGDVAGNTTVLITVKEGGTEITGVQFDGNAATIVSATDTVVTVKTPAGTAGYVDVYITSASSNDTWEDGFRYTEVFSPTQTEYALRLDSVVDIEAEFASRFVGAETPERRMIAGMIRVEGKQQRKITVTPEYRDWYGATSEENTVERRDDGTVFVNEPAPAPGTQIAMGMEEDLEPGDGGSVSFRFKKSEPDEYFEFEGFKFLYAELVRGI